MDKKDELFRPRFSYFDGLEPGSWINKNEMRGFYVMFNLVSGSYIVSSCVLHFERDGFLLESSFFWEMMKDIQVIATLWPCFFLWSWLALLLQLLVLKGLPGIVVGIIQHLTQSAMFLFAWYMVFAREWGFSQTVFVTFLALVHFMKMHSFTLVNRDLRSEWLQSPKTCCNGYPSNLNFSNFLTYMICPVLIYRISYPRTEKFRLSYFVVKSGMLFLQLVPFIQTLLYILIEDHIIPVISDNHKLPFLEYYIKLMLPMIFFYIIFFEVLFEQILNIFAELGRFADREFYKDWWNSSGWNEFNRKWNRPVHLFLYMHVYKECIEKYGFSESTAKFITFLFSALCHEMVCALIFRAIKPYLLSFMLLQLVLIFCLQPITHSRAGMYMFWLGILTGPPLIVTLYLQV